MTRLWHPFAAMGAVDGAELVIARGRGARVWDVDGREYLDATAGLWFANVGHGRAELAEAAAAQMRTLAAHQCFGDIANEPARALAERVAELSPLDDAAVFFGSGGSDAVDTAGKIARRYWSLLGQPERQVIVSRRFAYHGVNAYGTSLGGIAANQEGFGTLVEDVRVVPDADPAALAAALDELGPRAAAFIGEPVIGAGGVVPPPDGYWPEVERILRERDVLFIADEVICGFGRLGTWFGVERYGVTPDMITAAKGITSGYVPLGAVIASGKVRAPFWAPGAPPFRHGYTYSGHATACAVALANLDIVEREGLRDRVRDAEPVQAEALASVAGKPGVAAVRHAGLLGAIELAPELLAERSTAADEILLEARRNGVLSRVLRGVAFQFSPAFVSTDDELRTMVATVADAIDAVVR
jgi:adenosylmethionine-8-amino-7-oxononanoate aminotransferase